MKTGIIHHYTVLGLKPGASQEEIQSAFRSLAKLYHPDQDSSLDAEMRYKEIRKAYDALRKEAKARPETGATSRSYSPPPYTGNVHGKNWRYTESGGENKKSSFDFGDLIRDNYKWIKRTKRQPFSLVNLLNIFRISFKQVFGLGMTIRVFLATLMLWSTFTLVGWGDIWKHSTILCVMLVALLYRYYCQPRSLTKNIVGSLLCSVALSVLCTATTDLELAILWRASGETYHYGSEALFALLLLRIFIGLSWLWTPFIVLFLSAFVVFHLGLWL